MKGKLQLENQYFLNPDYREVVLESIKQEKLFKYLDKSEKRYEYLIKILDSLHSRNKNIVNNSIISASINLCQFIENNVILNFSILLNLARALKKLNYSSTIQCNEENSYNKHNLFKTKIENDEINEKEENLNAKYIGLNPIFQTFN